MGKKKRKEKKSLTYKTPDWENGIIKRLKTRNKNIKIYE